MQATSRRKKATKPIKAKLNARNADKHLLYEQSVQDPASDVKFMHRVFSKERGRVPLSLREDFCGTGYLCAEWAQSNKERHAIGLDLDEPTMQWGRARHLQPMGEAGRRVSLRKGNVLDGAAEPFDIITAFNFSYCCLLERPTMLAYMKRAYAELVDDGIYFLDIHGGPECLEEMEETTRHKGFTYVWDQGPYDAITNLTQRHIHFRFPDKSEMKRAFSYHWRPWQLSELRDILLEVGFLRVDVYWEGADEGGSGNGIFRKKERAEDETSWVAYIVAVR